jgi:hypothetical protein
MEKNDKQRRVDFDSRAKRQHAVVSKIVTDKTRAQGYDGEGNRKPITPPRSVLNAVSDRTASVTRDIESMEQLLPDIELAAQILVSSILSPKDMGAPNLNFTYMTTFEDEDLGGKLLKVVSDYFTEDYRINEQLSEILHDILFRKGSYPRMIIPESSLDQIINDRGRVSMESIRPFVNADDMSVSNLGLLGDSTKQGREKTVGKDDSKLSMESLFGTIHGTGRNVPKYSAIMSTITVIDNPDAVKMPNLYRKISSDKTTSTLASRFMTLEARRKDEKEKKQKKRNEQPREKTIDYGKNDRAIERNMDSGRAHEMETVVELRTKYNSDREMIGHPMVVHLSTEAVIPAHIPSNPKEHIGYFVLLDQFGNPISTSTATDHYRDLQASFQSSAQENQVTAVLKELRGNADLGDGGQSTVQSIHEATTAFADVIERNLLDRMRKGMGHDSIELARPNDVYQIMLWRTMQRKHTQMLYVPAELMSYMAFYYNNQGVGKSLLEESRILGSIRVMLMFANTMASIRNSTSRTELGIELDPNDTDPMSTIDQVRDAFMRSRSEQYPLGEGDPAAVVKYLQQSGVDVVYSGHPGLPEMRVETNERSPGKVLMDRDLEENLRHQHIMSLGLSPETVDTSTGIDFATTLVNSSLLLSKRVALYQRGFEDMQNDFVRKYTQNSETLITKLLAAIDEHGDADAKNEPMDTVDAFIAAMEVELPKPDSATLETQMESFRSYSDALDMAMDAWISDEFAILDAEGDVAQYLREMRSAVKAHYQRRWLRENNVLPELEEITEMTEGGDAMYNFAESQGKHMEAVLKSMHDYLEKAKTAATKRNEKLDDQQKELGEHAPGADGMGSSGGFGDDSGGFGEDTSDDSAGFGEEPAADDASGSDDGLGDFGDFPDIP